LTGDTPQPFVNRSGRLSSCRHSLVRVPEGCRVMRFIAVMLILLAVGKVGYQQYLYRSATADVMVTTFRDQAVAACQRDATATGLADRTAWASPSQVWFGVGNPHADVSVWQVDHARWGE